MPFSGRTSLAVFVVALSGVVAVDESCMGSSCDTQDSQVLLQAKMAVDNAAGDTSTGENKTAATSDMSTTTASGSEFPFCLGGCSVPLLSRALCLNKAGIYTELLDHIAKNPEKEVLPSAIMRAFNAGVKKVGHYKIQRTTTPQTLVQKQNPADDALAVFKCIQMHCSGSPLPCEDGYFIKEEGPSIAAEAEDLSLEPPFIIAPLQQSHQTVAGMDCTRMSQRLRIAVFLNTDAYVAEQPHADFAIAAWKYYCSLHGYTFIIDNVRYPFFDGTEVDTIPNSRIAGVLKHLSSFDYVVQISLDTVVVNRSFRFEAFLDGLPDVVIPLRTHLWQVHGSNRGMNFADWGTQHTWPLETFPERPVKVSHSPTIHTELIIVKNSSHGRFFCEELWKNAQYIRGMEFDMAAIQKVAMEFIHPETPSVKIIKQFGDDITQTGCARWASQALICKPYAGQTVASVRKCTNLSSVIGPDGFFGYQGLWCPRIDSNERQDALFSGSDTMMYYRLSTAELAKQRDWRSASGGHLRITEEGEILRDWSVGKLLRGGDFVLHTKLFAVEGALRDQLRDSMKEDGQVQWVINDSLFADAKASEHIAWSNGYHDMVFHKSQCPG